MGPDCAGQFIQRNWDTWQGKPQYFIEQAEKAVLGIASSWINRGMDKTRRGSNY
jgi:hypothetical protein